MPNRLKSPCSAPRCPNLVEPGTGGRCEKHKRPAWAGTTKNHGFKSGWEWSRIKAEHIKQYPYCEVCGKPVEEVHQSIKGSTAGLVSLCREHHRKVTTARRGRTVKD